MDDHPLRYRRGFRAHGIDPVQNQLNLGSTGSNVGLCPTPRKGASPLDPTLRAKLVATASSLGRARMDDHPLAPDPTPSSMPNEASCLVARLAECGIAKGLDPLLGCRGNAPAISSEIGFQTLDRWWLSPKTLPSVGSRGLAPLRGAGRSPASFLLRNPCRRSPGLMPNGASSALASLKAGGSRGLEPLRGAGQSPASFLLQNPCRRSPGLMPNGASSALASLKAGGQEV